MESGIISLKKLCDFVENNPSREVFYGDSPIGKEYGKVVKELTERIPRRKGVYLWVKYETNGLWENIYIGKSGDSDGPTAQLQWRITEELKKERAFLWTHSQGFANEEEVIEYFRGLPYEQDERWWETRLAKVGSTHIVWVSDSGFNRVKLRDTELLLIGMLDPKANDKLVKTVKYAKDVKGKMEEILRGNRTMA